MSDPEGSGSTAPKPKEETEDEYIPTKPVMGGIRKGKYNTAWTGGVPKVDWSKGLEEPNPKHLGQFQRRYEDGKAATFGYERRRQPLETKLSSIEQMTQFKLDVTHHLHEHGLDSIAHVPHTMTTIMKMIWQPSPS